MAAQEKARSAGQAVERQKQAVQRLWDEAREAEQQIEALQKRVREATEAHIASLADAAATGEEAPASGVPKAKKAVEAATDHLDAVKAARQYPHHQTPGVHAVWGFALGVEVLRLAADRTDQPFCISVLPS
jgi:hypothetical protein